MVEELLAARGIIVSHETVRYRWFADSPLEGDGFEPSVPRHGELMKFALTPCRREMDSNLWYRGAKAVDFRCIPGIAGDRRGS